MRSQDEKNQISESCLTNAPCSAKLPILGRVLIFSENYLYLLGFCPAKLPIPRRVLIFSENSFSFSTFCGKCHIKILARLLVMLTLRNSDCCFGRKYNEDKTNTRIFIISPAKQNVIKKSSSVKYIKARGTTREADVLMSRVFIGHYWISNINRTPAGCSLSRQVS